MSAREGRRQKAGTRVGVLAGGSSSEREISLISGKAVFDALVAGGRDAVFLDVKEDAYDTLEKAGIDAAFLALHGRFGEDGTIQGILEELGIPYTGSAVAASRRAIDKISSKELFRNAGIPVPEYRVVMRGSAAKHGSPERALPVVVKPQFEGSSMGLSIVRRVEDLEQAIDNAFTYGEQALIEEYIDGRELTVGIFGERALPVIEIVAPENVYDTDAKYKSTRTRYLVPAPLDAETTSRAKALGEAAHAALGCRDLSRVDMRLDPEGRLFVLEVNTIPGMTERSLFPKAAAAVGIDFKKLCGSLLAMALARTKKD